MAQACIFPDVFWLQTETKWIELEEESKNESDVATLTQVLTIIFNVTDTIIKHA